MKKLLLGILLILCTIFMFVFTACGPTKLETFEANEKKRYVEIGETYNVPKPTAKDNKGNFIVAEVTAVDPDGKNVTVKNFKFTPEKLGEYTVTYTVTVGEDVQSKSYVLEVYDETEPLVDVPFMWYNIAMPGATLNIDDITATDNSGERVTPVTTVYFNNEVVEPVDGVVTFSEIGNYTVNVTCIDASGNEEDRDYYIWTCVDYEDGILAENEWYPNRVRDYYSRNGEKSMEISLFYNHDTFNWFNDSSLLGELYFYGSSEENPYKYLSYWIYFDFEDIDVNATAHIKASWYDIVGVYDVYGNPLSAKFTTDEYGKEHEEYEFSRNSWYRIVTDVSVVSDPVDHTEVMPIDYSLWDYGIYFGLWNVDENSNEFRDPALAYIDDIRFIDINNDDEVYEVSPLKEIDNYDKGERITHVKYAEMVYNVGASQGADVTLKDSNDNELLTYNFKHGLVDDELNKFEYYGTEQLGLDTTLDFFKPEEKRAHTSAWQIFTGNNDAFVYEITAKKTVIIDLKAQIREDLGEEGFDDDELGIDGAEGSTDGWLDGSEKIRIYLKDANGEVVKLLEYSPSTVSGVDANGNPTGYELNNVVLKEGYTLYYEYSFAYQDLRCVSNPPYLNVYTATPKNA